MKVNKIAALAVVLMLAVCALVPLTADDSSAVEEVDEEQMIQELTDQYGVIPFIIVVAGYSIWQVIGAAAIGAVAGAAIMHEIMDSKDREQATNVEYYKQLRDIKGDDWTAMMDTIQAIVSSIIPADTDLWAFTTAYWSRAAELVCAEIWSLEDDYDPDATVGYTLLRENLENYLYNWQATIDKAYNNVLDSRIMIDPSDECWGNMKLYLDWAEGSLLVPTDKNKAFAFDLTQYVKGASAGSKFFLDARTESGSEAGTFNSQTSATLYNLGTSTIELTKLRVYNGDTAGNTIVLKPGEMYTMSPNESGLYQTKSNNTFLAGPLSKSADCDVEVGGMLVVRSDDTIKYFLPNEKNVIEGTAGSSTTSISNSLKFKYTYTGRDNTESISEICNGSGVNFITEWDKMVRRIGNVVDKTATAGETIWGIFDATEASSSMISPSSVTASVKELNLSSAEQQAITVQAMTQIASYWQEYGENIQSVTFLGNLDSSELYMYGDIYYQGSLVMENTIFTPYMAVSAEQVFKVGQMTEWEGAGYAMAWAQPKDFYSWDEDKTTSSGEHMLLPLGSDYSIQVKKIKYKGEEVDSFTLKPTVIKRQTVDPNPIDPTPTPVKIVDLSDLIIIIMIELAIILFLLGYIGGQPLFGAIAAVIVLIIGFFFSDTIAQIILGTFEWPKLF